MSNPSLTNTPLTRRAVLGGAAAVGLSAVLAACGRTTDGAMIGAPASRTPQDPTVKRPVAERNSRPNASTRTVTVRSLLSDGEVVGVGMPIVLTFDPAPTDAAAFVKAATVTVDGQPAEGAWHWSKPYAGEPIEAHYRTRDYWPANSHIELALPIGGLSAGDGLSYGSALTSIAFRTGDKRVVTVDGAAETAVVTVNDRVVRTMKASLGKSATPTTTGIKLVMQKGEFKPGTSTLRQDGAVIMQDVGKTYPPTRANWSVRITANGEYLHAAPWNTHIGQISTSDGCTNLSNADAEWFYEHCELGDVVIHRNTGGKPVAAWDGFTDWNVPWSTWQQGGLL